MHTHTHHLIEWSILRKQLYYNETILNMFPKFSQGASFAFDILVLKK